MAEYTELILELRKIGRKIIQFGNPIYNEVTAQRMLDAADAIVNADSWKRAFEVEHDEHRWIPVSERLPEKSGPYLCCWKASADDKLYIARVLAWRADTGWMNSFDEQVGNVTHFMPLPEPPEEE